MLVMLQKIFSRLLKCHYNEEYKIHIVSINLSVCMKSIKSDIFRSLSCKFFMYSRVYPNECILENIRFFKNNNKLACCVGMAEGHVGMQLPCLYFYRGNTVSHTFSFKWPAILPTQHTLCSECPSTITSISPLCQHQQKTKHTRVSGS